MPKVLSYTPPWLSRPSPGFEFFNAGSAAKREPRATETDGKKSSEEAQGARRTTASRGTDIFAVVGNEIRWSDLVYLKEQWEVHERRRLHRRGRRKNQDNHAVSDGSDEGDAQDSPYRVLKVPTTRPIRQLSISPQGQYMAIATSHTVHIAILPDPSHLADQDSGPLRPKTFKLGPTAHVLENAPIASLLWHPLGVSGSCLLTITTDAVVRLWELDKNNRWSFDNPALAVDLKKLANGIFSQEDFSPRKYGANRGYSPDSFEMEVAAASFGGSGAEDEHGWAGMTLWVAMKEGDVYALCPLLPNKWCPPSTLIPSLSTSVVGKAVAIEKDADVPEEERKQCEQQYKWFSEIDRQEPIVTSGSSLFEEREIYTRPSMPGPVPRLQGPFQIDPDIEDEFEATDIHVVAGKLDDEQLMDGEDLRSDAGSLGLSVGIICLLSKTGQAYVCLDLDGVEAQWLPSKQSTRGFVFDEKLPSLLLFEKIQLLRSDQRHRNVAWPTFSVDPLSQFSLFVTHDDGISFLSLDTWAQRLEDELEANTDAGGAFRLDVLLSNTRTLVEDLATFPSSDVDDGRDSRFSSCIALQNSDLGYLTLTTISNQPFAAVLDLPNTYIDFEVYEEKPLAVAHPVTISRQPYQGHPAFEQPSALPTLFSRPNAVSGQVLRSMREEIHFSPATLQIFTEVHRTLSEETHAIGLATADLFRRCERLVEELKDQVRRVAEVNVRVGDLIGNDDDDTERSAATADGVGEAEARVERRIEKARSRQIELVRRTDEVKRKVARLGGRELSIQEKALRAEVEKVREEVLDNADEGKTDNDERGKEDGRGVLALRYEEIKAMKNNLMGELAKFEKPVEGGQQEQSGGKGLDNGLEDRLALMRREKMVQIMGLLERETALVDATTGRLEKLSFG